MSLATETTYVTNIFQNVLFHTAADVATAGTTAQINSWANLIVSGTLTEAQVLSNLSSSNEVVNYVLPIVQLYEGFYHATPDIAGLTNWVNYFRSVAPMSASGTPASSTAYQSALSSIAQVFATGTQFTNTYGSAPTAAAFVTALYQNILGRAPDAAGLAGYVAYLTSTAGASPSVSAMASLALSFINSTEAKADATPAVESWLSGGINGTYATTIPGISSPAATTQALTTGIDNLVGTTANNVFTGVVGGYAPARNGAARITGSSSGTNTLKLIDVSTAAVSTNELAGVTLSNVQNVIVTNVNTVAGGGTIDGLYDFTTVSGVTTVESLNSTGAGIVKFTNLAAGTNVEASGAATTASVNFTYLSASSAPTVTVDGGISGITLANVGASAAPTAAPINSPGAATSA
ncbi:MAG: DUF4214 domain-containing protein, partial [Methanobacterium sp.]|nr:DUF4214 domain-containing protein [Methanobacterium sp.]